MSAITRERLPQSCQLVPIAGKLWTGSVIVALAYLGESLFGPVVGTIAQSFGRDVTEGYGFISAAFCGSAISGLIILVFIRDRHLDRALVVALALGAILNLLALTAPNWGVTIALRVGSGICFGIAVAAVVIRLAESSSGALLARRMSYTFSIAFLIIIPALAAVPHLTAPLGVQGLAVIHAGFCLVAALAVRTSTRGLTQVPREHAVREIRRALPRVFWSGQKTLAFSLHAANLFAIILILIGLQPAFSARGLSEVEIGRGLVALSGSTFVGGFIHSWLSLRLGIAWSRWALLTSDIAALMAAAALAATESGLFMAAIALAAKGICGGPPTFESMLFDLGPRDAAAAGLQRSLGMIAAIAGTILVLGAAKWLQLDILWAVVVALGLSTAWQIVALACLPRLASHSAAQYLPVE